MMKWHYPPDAHAAGSAAVTQGPCGYLKAASEVGHLLVPGLGGCGAANC